MLKCEKKKEKEKKIELFAHTNMTCISKANQTKKKKKREKKTFFK